MSKKGGFLESLLKDLVLWGIGMDSRGPDGRPDPNDAYHRAFGMGYDSWDDIFSLGGILGDMGAYGAPRSGGGSINLIWIHPGGKSVRTEVSTGSIPEIFTQKRNTILLCRKKRTSGGTKSMRMKHGNTA